MDTIPHSVTLTRPDAGREEKGEGQEKKEPIIIFTGDRRGRRHQETNPEFNSACDGISNEDNTLQKQYIEVVPSTFKQHKEKKQQWPVTVQWICDDLRVTVL